MTDAERHLVSEILHPRSALYPAPPLAQRADSPPKKRRTLGAHHKGPARYKSASCLSAAILDAGLDPAAAEFRNFFPYIPNEVKHRKRTSNEQAKVLESAFDRNTKPDSALRQRLAKELGMMPRGVQVWFQNRRAKEKLIGKKALAANTTMSKKPASFKTESSTEPNVSSVPGDDFQSSPASSRAGSSSPESSPKGQTHISTPPELPSLPTWATSQSLSPEMPKQVIQQPGPPHAPADLYNMRRPSLPTIIRHTISSEGSDWSRPPVNLLARRGSVERLGGNPYARFLMSQMNSYQHRPTSLRESHDRASLHEAATFESSERSAFNSARPMLQHRASMPYAFAGMEMLRRASMPTDLQAFPSSSTFRMPDDRSMYAISSRTVSAPIPGPLPTPNFSFGPPADSPTTSSPAPTDNDSDYLCHVPELANFSFGCRADDNDIEDDITSTSYDVSSRFGSITSIAGSESSNTSAYYSDVGSCNELPSPEARRGSYASSGQFLDLISGLDLDRGGNENMTGTISAPIGSGDGGNAGSATYPSPVSTVSPGCSHGNSPPGNLADTSTASLPISGSSELAHALQPTHEQAWDSAQPGPSNSSANPNMNTSQYSILNAYVRPSTDSGSVYPQVDSHLSSQSLPEPAQKSYVNVESNQFSNTNPYHNPSPYPQTSTAESHHSTAGCYAPYNGQDVLEHRAMEYNNNSGYPAGAIDMSHIISTVENTLHTRESYLQYP